MKYTVINHDISVKRIQTTSVIEASIFFVGDARRVSLSSAFDTPPERMIVGVTLPPFIPLVPPA